MSKGARAELERMVQDLDRAHPDWAASEVEAELERLAPVRFGDWKDNTPNPKARLRQIQRWRVGSSGPVKRPADRPLFHHVWPVGERQRQELDSSFRARSTRLRASHRIFLYNCSDETLREVRIRLGDHEVGFEPALGPGRLTEIQWFKNPAIRAAAMSGPAHQKIVYPLFVEFAVSRGTRAGRLTGEMRLDASDGWESFLSSHQQEKEII